MAELKTGLATAIQGLAEAHTRGGGGELAAPALPGEQPAGDLFGGETGGTVPKVGGGSRAGVPNKRTDSLKKWIMGLGYRHPAVVLAEIMSADMKDLRRELGLKSKDAAALKVRAAEALLPYFEQKLPTAVELPQNEGVPVLIIGEMATRRDPETGEQLSLDDAIEAEFTIVGEGEENQALSRPADGRHDDDAPTRKS